VYEVDGHPLSYQLIVPMQKGAHIWYSIINDLPGVENSKNLGKYLLTKTLSTLSSEGFKYCYLGTCYGENSRYKSDFGGAEFFNGNRWSTDLTLLGLLTKDDKEKIRKKDIFKSGHMPIAEIL